MDTPPFCKNRNKCSFFILRKSNNKSNRTLFLPKLVLWRAFFVANSARFMRKFLLIEGYLVGENELNGETFKKK